MAVRSAGPPLRVSLISAGKTSRSTSRGAGGDDYPIGHHTAGQLLYRRDGGLDRFDGVGRTRMTVPHRANFGSSVPPPPYLGGP